MFARVIPELLIDEIPFLTFLLIILSPASTTKSLLNFLKHVIIDSFTNEFVTEFANDMISLIDEDDEPNRNPPNYAILDNFEILSF